jgi:hypothetical protein
MTDFQNTRRRAIADAAEAVLADPAAYPAFAALVQAPDYDDPQLEDLIDQIEHLPPRSRLFGIGDAARNDHYAMIRGLIAAARA